MYVSFPSVDILSINMLMFQLCWNSLQKCVLNATTSTWLGEKKFQVPFFCDQLFILFYLFHNIHTKQDKHVLMQL